MKIDPEKPNYIVHAYTNGYWSYWGCVTFQQWTEHGACYINMKVARAVNQDGSAQEAAEGSVIYQYAEVTLASNDIRIMNNVRTD